MLILAFAADAAVLRYRGNETPLDHAFVEDWENPVSSPVDVAAPGRDARRPQVASTRRAHAGS